MAPRERDKKRVSPPRAPTRGEVAAAVVHLARLAAAHAGTGVEFAAANDAGEEDYPPDAEGIAAFAQVVDLLLEDRRRMRERAAAVLLPALHDAVTEVFREVRTGADAEERTEDLVAERLEKLGYVLGPSQMKRFDVGSADIKEVKGPKQAAADALVDGMEGRRLATQRGRRVFRAEERRGVRPPVAGPMHRYVPLRDVRRYLDRMLAAAVEQSQPDVLLPLEALGSDDYFEALLNRGETSFRKRMREDLERSYETMTQFFLKLLRGENPSPDRALTLQEEQGLAEFSRLGEEILASSPTGSEALVQKAREVARRWIADRMRDLDIEPSTHGVGTV